MKLLLLLVAFFPLAAVAQIDFFERVYQTGYATCVDTLPDGNFLLSATRKDGSIINGYGVILNEYGDKVDTVSIIWDEHLQVIRQTQDGGYVSVAQIPGGEQEAVLRKLDAAGSAAWGTTFPTADFGTYGASVFEHPSGTFFAGFVDDQSMSDNAHLIHQFNAMGIFVDEHELNSSARIFQNPTAMFALPDSDIIAISATTSQDCNEGFVLTRMDENGSILWSHSYADPAYNTAFFGEAISPSADGGFMIAGGLEVNPLCNIDPDFNAAFLIKTDDLGDTLWSKWYNWPNARVRFISIVADTDDHYYVTGAYTNTNTGIESTLLLKTDLNGDTLWSTHFFGLGNSYPHTLILDQNGNPVISGYSYVSDEAQARMYLVKTDTSGYVDAALQTEILIAEPVNELAEHADFEMAVFPNPSKDQLHIITTSQLTKIELLDLMGQVVLSAAVNQNECVIDLGNVVPGVYFVRGYFGDGTVINKVVVGG